MLARIIYKTGSAYILPMESYLSSILFTSHFGCGRPEPYFHGFQGFESKMFSYPPVFSQLLIKSQSTVGTARRSCKLVPGSVGTNEAKMIQFDS